ncbi:MAG: hypothetical protein H6548_04160 [Chitinophagales bacterium]|mgnify:CR=1 FL=1|nr:hypothetical protein [Chitinophagales bacterium]HAE14592.1 hypothetical protein [Bacteroidota bacterium]MCB9020192.1 hypothetical protein [Chitinophagales bacterium]MCB9021292.1 hypothetical protein [Chitinophagales bacterium]HAE35361.1 hypothetical protein [Bacteroidota bacterium]
MNYRKLLFLLAAPVLILSSCSKNIQEQINYEDFINQDDYRLMQVAYYTETQDGKSLAVRFYESPRIFDLRKDLSQFDEIKKQLDISKDEKTPVQVYASDNIVSTVRKASENDMRIFAEWHQPVIETRSTLDSTINSIDELMSIWDFIVKQSCDSPTVSIDQCISFQYVVDGCYARAHKMKQILEDNYGYALEKCFSFEDASGYLAVDAGDCCVYWWYHVAPYVKVQTPKGILSCVLDPSMFNKPVTKEKWFKFQENTYCSPGAKWGYYEIQPSSWYGPGGSTDPYYTWTNYTLNAYSDLVTCP